MYNGLNNGLTKGEFLTHRTGLMDGEFSGLAGADASTVGYCLEARMLFLSMTVQPEPARKKLINDFIVGCKQDGNWDIMDFTYFLASHDSQSSKLNWKNPNLYNLIEVSSPTFTTDRGWTGNGTSSYLNTGYSPFSGVNISLNNISLGVYSRTNSQLNSVRDMGAVDGSTNGVGINLRNLAASHQNGEANNVSIEGAVTVADSLGLGCFSRVDSGKFSVIRNGVNLGITTSTSTLIVNRPIYICCQNGNGTATFFSTRQLSFAYIGSASIDQLKLYNRVQTYLTALGAQV